MKTVIMTYIAIILCQVMLGQKTEAYFGLSGRNDALSNIIELYDKGYYISGGFENTNGFYTGWNIKTDLNLEYIYDKENEHPLGTVAIKRSTSDNYGNVYITGFITYPDQWPFVSKIDSCGEYQWCKILNYEDGFNFGSAYDILLTDNDEVVVLAYLYPDDHVDMTHLIGLSLEGDVLWKKPYASKNDYPWIDNAIGYSIFEIDKEFYISGKCYWPYPDDTIHVFLRPLFIGIDSLFNEKWILPFAPLDSVFGKAYKTIPLNDSVFMGVGIRRLAESKDNSLLMFYNQYGEELGYNEIYNEQIGPDINSNEIRDIQRINDTLFMTASFFGPDNSENPAGEFVIDTAANLYNFESRPNTYIPKLIKTADNNYVIATSIEETKGDWDIYVYKIDENLNDVPFDPTPHNYDSLCPGGIQSGTTDLSDCLVWTNIGDAPSPGEYYASIKQIPIRAYPNPASEGSITFEFENTGHHSNIQLRCFDIYGKQMHKEKVFRFQGKSTVDVGAWQKGMYVAVVYSNGWPVGECKFVVQE